MNRRTRGARTRGARAQLGAPASRRQPAAAPRTARGRDARLKHKFKTATCIAAGGRGFNSKLTDYETTNYV